MVYNLKRLQNKTSLLFYPISTNLKHVVELVRGYFKNITIIKNNRKGAVGLDNFPKLEKILYDKANVILFTSLIDYNLINSVLKIKHTCIILETWGYDTCQFIESKGIDSIYYMSEFCNKEVTLEVMNVRPDHMTLEAIKSVDEPDVKRLLSVYVYSNNEEELDSLHRRPRGYEEPVDKPTEFGGWVTRNTHPSPKINAIFHRLREHKRNLVLTRFDDKYGSNLIRSILYTNGINCTGKLEVYNASENDIILVTNEYDFDSLAHVDAMHIVDDYDVTHLCKIVRKFTSNNCEPLRIVLYPLQDSIDARDAGCFESKLRSMITSYNLMVEYAKHI